ncbi:MAG: serine hydrolase [Nannocystis sp.]|nr:serine hydrolase [Nannocystis sp.]MBA3545019.1 serine hydrolase [Nannocystis sp.]
MWRARVHLAAALGAAAFALAADRGCADVCTVGDRGLTPPAGLEESTSCLDADPEATRVVIAGRVFCDLAAFPIAGIVGDYHDDVATGFRFDAARFTAEVDAALTAAGARGYAWTLIQAGRPAASRVVAEGRGGFAVAGADAPGGAAIPFTTRTPSNIGSVTKLLAAVGLVRAYERVVADLPPEQRYTLRQLLNVPFFALLPTRWQSRHDTDNGLREVTIGQLLLHTSRLVGAERDRGVDDIIESLAHDSATADLADNPRGYANINYRLLFVLIGALLDPDALRTVERDHADRCDADFDDAYLRAAAVLTRDHLESFVFSAVPGEMPATDCDPATFGADWKARIAWAYRDERDGDGSTYNSFTANPGYCSTTGGYYSSADDLGALLHAYHGGLITPEHRTILEGGSGMGWYAVRRASAPFGDPVLDASGVAILRKHGTQPIAGTDDIYRASTYKLPYGHYLALTVNSSYADGSSPGTRGSELAAAFAAAFSLD